ncbi:hypothetical protein [Gordonia shandongensis]|uniref:hypothetical protein n=1 Tax=Gordonia shandongensis TaxID=376351 RepID=UPI0003FE5EC4|nr:hypothetical protein [Gordonia shandongensis]
MSARRTTLPALLLGESSEAWGDERERSVMLEAYAYVFVLATVALWTLAAIAAWFVPVWVTVALFVCLLVPTLEWQRYCSARDVDAQRLAFGGASALRATLTGLYFGGCAVSMIAAVMQSVWPGDTIAAPVAGGAAGAIGAVVWGRIAARRAAQREAATDDD